MNQTRFLSAHPARAFVVGLVILGLSAFALGQGERQVTVATSGVAATVNTLDPLFDSNTSEVVINLFDSLVMIERQMVDGQPRFIVTDQGVATAWEPVDSTTWAFSIRPGIVFHDGTALSARDVAFSINQILNPEFNSRRAAVIPGIAGAEAVDDSTVHVFTNFPLANAVLVLSRVQIVPEAYYTSVGSEAFSEAPIGSGPYVFESWSRGDFISLRANDNYWQGRPAFDRAVFRNITEASGRAVAIRSGQAQIVNNIPPSLFADLANDSNVQTVIFEGNQHVLFGIDGRSGPLADVRVRQAMMHAIDREEIIDVLYGGQFARPVTGIILQGLPGYDATLESMYPFDLERARELMREAGYANGFTTQLLYSPGVLSQVDELVQAYIGYLGDIGITLQLDAAESGSRLQRIRDGEVPGIFSTSCGNQSADPAHCFNLWISESAGRGWYWPGVFNLDQELVDLAGELNDAVRAERFVEFNRRVAEQAPFIMAHHENIGWATATDIDFMPTWQGYTDLRNASLR
jgi:peptide/nickel transport system substrate-binding protein